jgi:hypothetical protein
MLPHGRAVVSATLAGSPLNSKRCFDLAGGVSLGPQL